MPVSADGGFPRERRAWVQFSPDPEYFQKWQVRRQCIGGSLHYVTRHWTERGARRAARAWTERGKMKGVLA